MLAGQSVLIVESEIIISLSMQVVLQAMGAGHVTVLTSPEEFRIQGRMAHSPALAVIEVESRRHDQLDLVRTLRDAGIPVLGLTADSALRNGMPDLPDMPFLVKPVPDDSLVEAVLSLLRLQSAQNE